MGKSALHFFYGYPYYTHLVVKDLTSGEHEMLTIPPTDSSTTVEKNFFNHYNSYTPAIRAPDRRIKMFGVDPTACGENIDMTYLDAGGSSTYLQLADKIVKDFYESPPHRKNMMSKAYSHLGCGALFELKEKSGVRYIKATQDFSANSN